MVVTFYAVTNVKSAPIQILRDYIKYFGNSDSDAVADEVQKSVVLSEKARRPRRNIKFCIGVDTNYYHKFGANLKNKESKITIFTPKFLTGNKQEYPYRLILYSKILATSFLTQSQFKTQALYFKHIFKLRLEPTDFAIYFPEALFVNNYVRLQSHNKVSLVKELEKDQFEKFGYSIPIGDSNQKVESKPKVEPTQKREPSLNMSDNEMIPQPEDQTASLLAGILNLTQSIQDQQQVQQHVQPVFSNNHQIKLGNIWSPDSVTSGTLEDLIAVLLACKTNNSFQNDANLIFSYLADNSMLSRLGDLSEEQKTSLDSFITWLRTYVRVDDVFYKTQFKAMKQKEDQSFRTFFLNLTEVYKKAYNRVESWSENDLKSIKRKFLKGLADSRIRDKLMALS